MKKTVKKFITLLCAVLLLSTSAIFSFPSTASENESNAESKIMLQKEHSYGEWYVVVHPTETEFGLSRRDCSECDAYETKTIAKLSDAKLTDTHNFSGKEEIITPASCTADGSKKVYCTEDGCGAYRSMMQIVFPLLKPATVTLGVLYFLWCWNDFVFPNIMLGKEELRTITMNLYVFRSSTNTEWDLFIAGLTVSLIPIVIIYILAQKHITSGLTAGSIK